MDAPTLIDYAKSLDCIHCGMCLSSCPTYRLTGREASSPRGRVHLMRAVAEGALAPDRDVIAELDFCLLCRGCESVCPSGVRFGAMMETARDGVERLRRRGPLARLARAAGFGLLASRRRLALAARAARLAQRTGLVRLAAPLLGARGRALRDAPPVPPAAERAPLAALTPAAGSRRGAVALLQGCVQAELFGRVNRDSARLLAALGLDVHAPRGAACCGSLHAHNGELAAARRLARATIEAFDAPRHDAPLPVVVNSAGCGAHMKAYGELFEHDAGLRPRAEAFAARVRDLSEILASPEHAGALAAALRAAPRGVEGPLAYDDPCHLCHGQGVRAQPRALLDRVPGLARVELEGSELCCGSAGIYSLARPADAAAILLPKLDALVRSGARTLVTANPGCQIQWEAGVRRAGLAVRVMHLAEVLAGALGAPEEPAQPPAAARSA